MPSDFADLSRNNLDRAASPYLLQHRDNPVHWQMWSEGALAAAASEDRPILLSIGYAACHWCHVMAHESFEDAATADVMNELFVNIKVDREERPDIDQIYMGALHKLGEAGGWPLTMFLTSKGEPFWGGTYFPKEPRFGRPAFTEILRAVAATYHGRRSEVESNARELSAAIAEHRPPGSSADMTASDFDDLARRLAGAMDRDNGGLPGAPKFPNAPLLEFLWRAGEQPDGRALREPVTLTLDRIVAGGIHDHLGGGFARYTVDERWLVPHFEKMLYDNAQLLELLALAYHDTNEPEFRQAAQGLVDWLKREMMVDEAFAASLDADSEGEEGKFYVWTRAEIDAVLGAEDGALFARLYDAAPPGNWTDEHSGLTRIILNRLDTPRPTPTESARLAVLRAKLLEARSLRPRPGRDDKILADWNGMMIAALAGAGAFLGEAAWINLADKAFGFISTTMTRRENGRLRLAHSYRDHRFVWPGMASDYVMMIRAATFLAEAKPSDASSYLDLARDWNEALRQHHLTPEGLLATSANDSTDVILRLAPTTDDAIPNPNGVYATTLLRLAALTGEDRFRTDAEATLAALAGPAKANPFAHASAWNALDAWLHMAEILVAGPEPGRSQLWEAAQKLPFLHRVIRELSDNESVAPDHPAAAFRNQVGNRAAALICYGGRCSLPVHSADEIAPAFATMRR